MKIITRYKLFENVQQSKRILKELDIPESNDEYVQLREMLKKNVGYLGKFTQWLFDYGVPLEDLERLYKEIREFRNLDKPLDSFSSPYNVFTYIREKNNSTKLNQIIRSIPSRTRKLVDQRLKDLLMENIEYADYIKDLYSKRSGGYESVDDFITFTSRLINNIKSGWNVDSIKYKESEVVYKDNITLILHIPNYKRSCELGTTYWCITTDEERWDAHTENYNKQYFIYDFSKTIDDINSLIGVTIKLNGEIDVAFYRDNTELLNYDELNDIIKYLKPYSKEDIDMNDM